MNLADQLQAIEPDVRSAPWAGYEHYRGYAVMVLPFSSGHLLGLRVFPENDFAPYVSVWHRTPDGDWSIYNDGPSLKTTCPRWWGPALVHTELMPINVSWTGPNELLVEVEEPRLAWKMTMTAPRSLQAMNAVSAVLPLWTWKPTVLLRIREWIARHVLGLGDLHFSFATPHGHDAVFMPEQIFYIASSEATFEGDDLGHLTRLSTNPTIGGVPLPTRASFVIGQALAKIKDAEEYRKTREEVRQTA